MPLPSPVVNKHIPQYLVIDGRLTYTGWSYMKMADKIDKLNRINKSIK
jgi:hypothetical protein